MLDPASGSVIAKTTLARPLARPGSHSLRSSGEPNSPITSAEIAAETSRSSSGAPWFAISSQTIASSTSPPPPPPYSSATLTPMKPASPSALHSSSHGVPARACVDVVVAAEPPGDRADGRAEIAMLVALEEVHGDSSDSRFTCGDRTARLP